MTEPTVEVLVPFRPDGGPRDRSWAWLRRRWALIHPTWTVHAGAAFDGEVWRKGRSFNLLAAQATADVLVLADADVWTGGLTEAARLALEHPWVVPHRTVHRLTEAETDGLLAAPPTTPIRAGRLIKPAYTGVAGGGLIVIRRDRLPALDECFYGWGGWDESTGVSLDTLLGRHRRLPQKLWHLWHPPGARGTDPAFVGHGRPRLLRYRHVVRTRDLAGLRGLMEERT